MATSRAVERWPSVSSPQAVSYTHLAHVAAKEIILDNVNFHIDHGVLAVELVHHLCDEGACHGAGDHIDLFGAVDAVGPVQLRPEFILEQAHHAHAVFQLIKVLIELCRGDGPPRLEVPLIAGVDDALAVAALALIAKLLHNVDDLSLIHISSPT